MRRFDAVRPRHAVVVGDHPYRVRILFTPVGEEADLRGAAGVDGGAELWLRPKPLMKQKFF
jgi:hypothetical protein